MYQLQVCVCMHLSMNENDVGETDIYYNLISA